MTIRISQDVYDAVAARGAFGETPDDVLRRVLDLPPRPPRVQRTKRGAVRLSDLDDIPRGVATVIGKRDRRLVVKLAGAPVAMWKLSGLDADGLAAVREEAVAFARERGASGDVEAQIDSALAAPPR